MAADDVNESSTAVHRLSDNSNARRLLQRWIRSGCRQTMDVYVPRRCGTTTLLQTTAQNHSSLELAIDTDTGLEMLIHTVTGRCFIMGTPAMESVAEVIQGF